MILFEIRKRLLLLLFTIFVSGCISDPGPVEPTQSHRITREAPGPVERSKRRAHHLFLNTDGHTDIIRELIFTADGRELISVSNDKTVRIWEISQDGREHRPARVIRGEIGDGRAGEIYAAALSPPDDAGRQRWLAVAGSLAGSEKERYAIRLHDYDSGKVVALLLGHSNVVNSLAFSPKKHWLASAGKDNTILVWDLTSLSEDKKRYSNAAFVLIGHVKPIYDLAWASTGRRLASASYDYKVGLWDTEPLARAQKPELIKMLQGHRAQVQSVVFHPDGQELVSGGLDQTIRRWRVDDGHDLGQFAKARHRIAGLSFSPDGRWLLAGREGGTDVPKHITLYDYPAGTESYLFKEHNNIVLTTAFHPSRPWAVSGGGDDNEILLWHVATHDAFLDIKGQGRTVWTVGFVDNHTLTWGQTSAFATPHDRGPLEHSFSLDQMEMQFKMPPVSAVRARVAVGNKRLSAEYGGPFNYAYRLKIRGTSTVIDRSEADGYQHTAFTFTPDGQHVLSGGFNGTLMLYDTETGEMRADLVGHTGEVKAVAASPDGRWAVSGATDQILNLWFLANLPRAGYREILPTLTLFPADDGEWVAWIPEGYFATSVDGDKYVGWHYNHGVDSAAEFHSFSEYPEFDRGEVVKEYLTLRNLEAAVRQANRKAGRDSTDGVPINALKKLTPPNTPRIIVYQPDKMEVVATSEFFPIQAKVLSDNVPITHLEVILNGRRIMECRGGVGNACRQKIELEIPIQQGENRLTITASAENSAPHKEDRIIICEICRPKPKPDLFLLSVGISDYQEPALKLEYADRDAGEIVRAFEQQGGVFDRVEHKVLLNRDASKEAILEGLNWLNRTGTQQDFVALFLSGHGGFDRYGDYHFYTCAHGTQGGEGAQDTHASDVHWKSIVEALTDSGRPAILMLDTCHTTITGGRNSFIGILRNIKQNQNLLILSASNGEKSWEMETLRHGAFTYALIEGLMGAAERADKARGKGIIDSDELADYIKNRVPELTENRQTPYHNAGTFPSLMLRALPGTGNAKTEIRSLDAQQ